MKGDGDGAARDKRHPRSADVWLAVALLAAFSPALFDLAGHWVSQPWARYSVVFVPLLAWCALRGPAACPRPWLGSALIAVALVIQLLAAMASQLSVARPAVAIAVVGFLLLRGIAPLRTALLALLLVPVPHTLTTLLGGVPLVRALFGGGAAIVSGLGARVELDELSLSSGEAVVALDSVHAGLPLLVLLLGLAAYAALRLAPSPRSALRLAVGAVLAAVVLEIVAVLIACAVLASGSGTASLFVLESLSWMVPALCVVGLTERAVECRERAGIPLVSGRFM
jgi:hypothetical protein